jgi:hypothetical protein
MTCPPTIFLVDSGPAGGAFACPPPTLEAAGIERDSTKVVNGRGAGGEVSVRPFDVRPCQSAEPDVKGFRESQTVRRG